VTHQQIEGILFWFPAFVFSTTVHEAAHAWAALRGGDPTAYRGGQVSLNPSHHIRREPIGMLVLPLFTAITNGWAMGWASAPFDPEWAARHPRRAALMAAAGPAANLALALIAFIAIRTGLAFGWFETPPAGLHAWSMLVMPAGVFENSEFASFAARGLSVMLSLNVLLATFNLIPVPPLDGSAVVDIVVPGAARFFRGMGPAASILGLLVAWKVMPMFVGPIFAFVEAAIGA
jgi:Zn-dependent protease